MALFMHVELGKVHAEKYTGKNLEEMLQFTGKHPMFNEWFESIEDYTRYVNDHGNIFKVFGPHKKLYVRPGDWIVRDEHGDLDVVPGEVFSLRYRIANHNE